MLRLATCDTYGEEALVHTAALPGLPQSADRPVPRVAVLASPPTEVLDIDLQ
jgi:hypothetical protein